MRQAERGAIVDRSCLVGLEPRRKARRQLAEVVHKGAMRFARARVDDLDGYRGHRKEPISGCQRGGKLGPLASALVQGALFQRGRSTGQDLLGQLGVVDCPGHGDGTDQGTEGEDRFALGGLPVGVVDEARQHG